MAPPIVLLTYYCLLLLAASLVGGMLPAWMKLTHRGMQIAISFVAAMMFGVGMLHMLPHALAESQLAAATPSLAMQPSTLAAIQAIMLWVTAGCFVMFFIERYFSYHHHDFDTDVRGQLHEHDEHCDHRHNHHHDVRWKGAAIGLALHSVIEGIALAASVMHGHGAAMLAGLGAFSVILLHKPFDSMTIAMLMARSGRSRTLCNVVNAAFAGAIPVGMALFYLLYAEAGGEPGGRIVAYALAFSAGTFLCISLSDLLPELQFHDHDRGKLSLALLVGLALSAAVGQLEGSVHRHPEATNETPASE